MALQDLYVQSNRLDTFINLLEQKRQGRPDIREIAERLVDIYAQQQRMSEATRVLEDHSNVLWKVSELALPDMVSPLTDGKRLLLTHGGGELNCLDATTGRTLWTHNVDAMVHASPILVGDKVYLTDYKGVTHVFLLADEFKELATFPLGEEVTASPAVVDGVLYIRGKEHLYGIGKK